MEKHWTVIENEAWWYVQPPMFGVTDAYFICMFFDFLTIALAKVTADYPFEQVIKAFLAATYIFEQA